MNYYNTNVLSKVRQIRKSTWALLQYTYLCMQLRMYTVCASLKINRTDVIYWESFLSSFECQWSILSPRMRQYVYTTIECVKLKEKWMSPLTSNIYCMTNDKCWILIHTFYSSLHKTSRIGWVTGSSKSKIISHV